MRRKTRFFLIFFLKLIEFITNLFCRLEDNEKSKKREGRRNKDDSAGIFLRNNNKK